MRFNAKGDWYRYHFPVTLWRTRILPTVFFCQYDANNNNQGVM